MSHQDASVKSIIFALSANLGIAITKTIAAILTGSGAMLAESIHSFADCGNQGLLFLGLNTSKKRPDAEHPLGHGKSIYFWSFIVALMLFSMGGLFSVYEGVHKLSSNEELKSPFIAIAVLAVSMLLEGASLFGCIKEINKLRGQHSLLKWLKNSRQSELIVVFGEDVAALFGLAFALLSVVLSLVTGNPVYDSIGLLIGQSADDQVQTDIKLFLNNRPEVESIFNLITLQLGAQIMVAVKAKMTKVDTPDQLIKNINACEKDLKKVFPTVQWVFFEPDDRD
jgi:cation diffusion facilitator family transporter